MTDSHQYQSDECIELHKRIEILQQHILSMRNTYSNNYFETLIEDMPLAYHSLDEYGRLIRVNKAWLEMMGYEPNEVLGTVVTKYFTKKSLALFQRKFPAFKEKGVTKNVEFEFITKNGDILICEINGRIEYDKNGKMIVSHCMLNDITFRKQIEKEIREAKQNWQHMFQAISSPTVILNPDFTIVYANDAVLKASKLPIHEIIGQPCCKVFHGKHQEHPPKDCPTKKILEQIQSPQVAEMEIQAFNGIFLVSCTPIFTNEGKLNKIIHIATDISELKKLSTALEESEKRFRELANYLPQTIYECTLDGVFTFVNKSGLEMFGYTQEELEQGLNLMQMLAPSEIQKAKENIAILYKEGKNQGNEYIGKHKNGSTFPILIYTNVVYKNSKPIGIRGILIDLTEQKRTEYIIQENQRVLSSLLANTPGLLYRCKNDLQWTMSFISQQCIAITGYTPDEFIDNKTLSFNDIIAPEYQEIIWNKWQDVINKKSTFTFEYQIIHKSGERRWVYESGNPIFDEHGALQFLEGYIEDITERKQTELALRHSLLALSEPLDSTENISFTDLFNITDIQIIQDEFSAATGVFSIITDVHGNPITNPSNFCKLCSKVRNTEKGKELCKQANTNIGKILQSYSCIDTCISLGLPYSGAKIEIGGKHIANWLIGQVRFAETSIEEIIIKAEQLGLQKDEIIESLQSIPLITTERFNEISKLLNSITQELSLKAYQNIQQARFITQIQKKELALKEKNDEVEAQNEEYQQLNEELAEANKALQKAKEIAQKNEEKYRLLFTEMEQGIAVHEVIYNDKNEVVDYRFIDINPAYERITGITKEIALNKRVREILPNVEDYWIETFGKVAVTGIPIHYENTAAELNKHFEVLAYRPQPHQFAVIVTDITERKNTELLLKEKNDEIEAQNEEYMQLNEELVAANQELYLAKQKAEESDKLKSAFLANLSHEIRTPMNAILGFSDLLADKDISYEHRSEYVNIVQKSGKHLLGIINDLIDVSKIETGQVSPYYSEISLQTFLKDLYNTLSVTIPEDKTIDFSLELHDIDSSSKIISDEVKLRQIIINLVTNALKFTETGFVKIVCSYRDQSQLECKVIDSGVGIAEQYYSVIFDRFRQIEGDLAIKKGGSGLGLAISKAYAEMLGGTITVSSEIGKGSTFTLSIPCYNEYKKPKKHIKKSEHDENYFGNNETILVAEDDDINFYYLTKIMSKTNYKIIRALNGEEAVTIVKNNPDVKLVLMDIKMPKMNGYEATNIIRSLDASLPVIAQTAYALSDEQDKIRQTNFTDYISKPLKRDVLLSLIKKHINS